MAVLHSKENNHVKFLKILQNLNEQENNMID